MCLFIAGWYQTGIEFNQCKECKHALYFFLLLHSSPRNNNHCQNEVGEEKSCASRFIDADDGMNFMVWRRRKKNIM